MQQGDLFTLKNYLYKKFFIFFKKLFTIHIACGNIAFVSKRRWRMADALDSGSSGGNTVRVRVLSPHWLNERNLVNQGFSFFYLLI